MSSQSPFFKLLALVAFSLGRSKVIAESFDSPAVPSFLQLADCPPFNFIENGKTTIKHHSNGTLALIIICDENYTLIGGNEAQCVNGYWKFGAEETFPKCRRRCSPPPYLEHGALSFQKSDDDVFAPSGSYSEGTVVTYSCNVGYTLEPEARSVRICEKGHWTGPDVFCKELGQERMCPRPPLVENGVNDFIYFDQAPLGVRVSYVCSFGYKLVGPESIMCTVGGIWIPEAPLCVSESESELSFGCSVENVLTPEMEARMRLTQISTSVVEVSCRENYQSSLFPCTNSKFFCEQGKWKGIYPKCEEAYGCKLPPSVSYSLAINRNFETRFDPQGNSFCSINSQVTYECLKGYVLEGSSVITCQSNGCWEAPDGWPRCLRVKDNENYFVELNNINALLISSATGIGVLTVLLFACVIVACKKRRSLARTVSLPSPVGGIHRHAPDVINDHTVLLQHPDRLALIAFADGVQNNQNTSLPSYDEATRDRSTLIQVSRLQIQRPHWPSLTVCRTSGRNRSSPNIDPGHHVPRHGSFASHTPSMRSGGGESMGSTETVTMSEGSTNVTLDTASSHSALSQNASCRGHCGSLASFDGCSVVNSEGIPLLEENELEDAQGSASNEAGLSDGSSTKLSAGISSN